MDLALNLTLVGISVVFLSLVVLSILISIGSRIFSIKAVKKNNAVTVTNINADKTAEDSTNSRENPVNKNELIAVLTAAVMANMQEFPDFKIRVKSFRRIRKDSPTWNNAGIAEQIGSRF